MVHPTADAAGVYLQHSLDGGATWERVPLVASPNIGMTTIFSGVAFDEDGAVTSALAAEGSQGVGAPVSVYIYGKRPGGPWLGPLLVWSGKTVFGNIPYLHPAAGSWWLFVGSTVSISQDGGVHWLTRSVPLASTAFIEAFDVVDSQTAYILTRSSDCSVSCPRTLLRTDDGGETWSSRTSPG